MSDAESTVTAAATIFDFVSDENFRRSLVSDYSEITSALSRSAWKSVHVLCGSVVEAILVDYLMATNAEGRLKLKKDPLNLELGEAIAACRQEGVLSERAADLSSVVRGYRNLIHPGRIVRLKEKIDGNTAIVAKALVDIVIDDMSTRKAEKYGFTAEQIIAKLEKDASCLSVLPHMLRDTNELERERLLTTVLPEKFFRIWDDPEDSGESLPLLRKCFHQAFETLPDKKRAKVVRRFITILKEESESHVLNYEEAFFRAPQLRYVSSEEAQYAKDHLIARIGKSRDLDLLVVLEGIGEFLVGDEAFRLTNCLMRWFSGNDEAKTGAKDAVAGIYWSLKDEDAREKVKSRVTVWSDFFEERQREEDHALAQELLRQLTISDEDIPF